MKGIENIVFSVPFFSVIFEPVEKGCETMIGKKMKRDKLARIVMFVLLVVYAVAMAMATFVENSAGTEIARRWFYHAPWFLAVELLLALDFIYLVVAGKMLTRKQWGGLLFHCAFVIILAGAAVTHFCSYEGVMHIREGEKANYMMMPDGTQGRQLPFEVYLKDFRLERYPGSHSPASYESDVIVTADGAQQEHMIYMNNVVDVKGYRLFQASYDPDEKGTVLSVNYDRAGMLISYAGYFLLVLGMILIFFNRNSRFRRLIGELKQLQTGHLQTWLILVLVAGFCSVGSSAQAALPDGFSSLPSVEKEQAEAFGKLIVQNPKGRLEPVNTWTLKILRKIYQAEQFQGLTSDQFFLNLMVYPYEWSSVPFIKVKNSEVMAKLGKKGEYLAFQDIFAPEGHYLLAADIEAAYAKNPSERSRIDNDLLKLDELVNIIYQIQSGQMLALFPDGDDPKGKWYSAGDDLSVFQDKDSLFVSKIMTWYMSELTAKNAKETEYVRNMIDTYQTAKNKTITVDKKKIEAEIFYNKARIFSVIFKYYLIFGGLLLLCAFVSLLHHRRWITWFAWGLTGLIFCVFCYHTFGLGLRWYISGYAPWTNSYESMVYVAWAVVFGGLLFALRTRVVLALTSLLGGVLLFVSSLNQMSPEITPLVPVLQSWWLMLHVSVIMAGYGFFFVSALIGLFNLVLMIVKGNRSAVGLTIREMTILNEMSMMLGLILMTIGTFLGAVWANESWGRYWGWDPKETWALISIIVYVLVSHLRFIPGWKSAYLFNLLSVLSVSAILMTYFGVNYYLSGMHSYGKTDAQLLPTPFIIGGIVIVVLAVWAWLCSRKK